MQDEITPNEIYTEAFSNPKKKKQIKPKQKPNSDNFFYHNLYKLSRYTDIYNFFFFLGFLSLPALLFLTVCEAQAFVGPLILTTLTFWQWPRRCRISVAVEALSMSPPVPTKSHKMINKTSIPSYITYYKKKLNNMINIKENK